MSLTVSVVESLFASLVSGDIAGFFNHSVDENVIWTIASPTSKTCLISGRQEGLHSAAMTLAKLAPYFSESEPARTVLHKVLISGDEYATVLVSTTGTTKSGFSLDDRAAWICRIRHGRLCEVDMFCDTAAINQLVAGET